MKNIRKKRILLTGGGTAGSVSPLLAVAYDLRDEYIFYWIGTHRGPEKKMVLDSGIKFYAICNGKFRRYFSFKNFIDIFKIICGFFQSFFFMLIKRPSLIVSAGSFVSVPVAFAGKILSIPVLIHQQDVKAGLANKLMAPIASVITTTFEKSVKDHGKKAVFIGNPVIRKVQEGKTLPFDKKNLPLVLVVGGSTGSLGINTLIANGLPELVKFAQVIHVIGREYKDVGKYNNDNYHKFEFINNDQLLAILKSADVVVSRCGLASLTELSLFKKASILIPMPDSHQEENAKVFENAKGAIVLHEKNTSSKDLVWNIRRIIEDEKLSKELSNNISGIIKTDANEAMIKIIKRLIK